MLGTLALLATSSVLTPEQFLSWGWRLPFVLSLVLVAYGLWLRRSILETPVFRAVQEGGPGQQPPAARRHMIVHGP